MRKNRNIDRIYICKKRNSSNIISKVLIRFIDGNYLYFKLPSFYDVLTCKNKGKELKKLEKELEVYLKRFLKERNLTENDFNNEDLVIFKEGSWLEDYIDMKIRKIDKENNKKNIEKFSIEYVNLIYGSSLNFCSLLIMKTHPILTFLTTLISEASFITAIHNNKNRDKIKSESLLVKKIKLYFSYLMLIFNINLNFIDVDYDQAANEFDINFDISGSIKNTKEAIQSVIQYFELKNLENPFSESNDLLSQSEKLELLMNGLELNTRLSEYDSEIILSLEEFILENPYFDYEEAYDNLTSLEVKYLNSSKGNVAAAYYPNSDLIKVYNSEDITEEIKEENMQHESIHCLGGNLDNIVLDEGMTSLIQAEYFNNGIIVGAYNDHVWLTRVFCELITPEKMLEAYSTRNMAIIREEMLKINPDEEAYENLISVMQMFGSKFQENDAEIVSSLNYRYMLSMFDEEITLSEIFYKLLSPYYLNSEKVSEDSRKRIDDYLSYIGYWYNSMDNKMYFNEEKVVEKNYVKKMTLE